MFQSFAYIKKKIVSRYSELFLLCLQTFTFSYAKIIQTLQPEHGRVRWKDLLEQTRLSSRTLAKRTKELQKQGLVRRIVDTTVYPPAVYYEGTKLSYLMSLPITAGLDAITKMLEAQLQTRRIIETSESNPNKLMEHLVTEYERDFLFTLNYSIEDYEKLGEKSEWPYLVTYHVQAYESRIMELIRVALQSSKLREAIKNVYKDFKEGDDKRRNNLIQEVVGPFQDKELAEPMMKEYCGLLVQGLVKKPTDFFKMIKNNDQLKEKIEHDFGTTLDKKRLLSFFEDPGWKVINIEKSNTIEEIEKDKKSKS